MKTLIALCATVFALVPGPVSSEPVYARGPRTAYIADTLAAFEDTSAAVLADTQQYLYVVRRNQCRGATLASLEVGCLVEAARRNCRQQRRTSRSHCDAVSDVIVTNLLSENEFISRATRMDIMQAHKDYRAALTRELRRRYAALVTEMSLTTLRTSRPDRADLAAAIDEYCRDVAGSRDVSWHHCTAAIVWFIGTAEVSP